MKPALNLEAFTTLPIHINCLHPNTEDMTILYIYHNLSCICYKLLSINKQKDIFHLLHLFLSLITYRYQLKDLILLWSFLNSACHAKPGAVKQ